MIFCFTHDTADTHISAFPLIIHPLEPVPIIPKNTLRHIHHLRQHTSIQRCHPRTHIFTTIQLIPPRFWL